jgi:hypothetical protein
MPAPIFFPHILTQLRRNKKVDRPLSPTRFLNHAGQIFRQVTRDLVVPGMAEDAKPQSTHRLHILGGSLSRSEVRSWFSD